MIELASIALFWARVSMPCALPFWVLPLSPTASTPSNASKFTPPLKSTVPTTFEPVLALLRAM